MKHKKNKPNWKTRPRNEITSEEVETFLSSIRNFSGYPKLRDLQKLMPSIEPYKITVILRYLERSNSLIVDNDGYIIWTRDAYQPDMLTIGDVAKIDEGLKKFLQNNDDKEHS